ncbi:hypothetical protein ALO35_200190 [Pseudomonas amygdali pv. lachrymans]|uniref:Uncharacterized protein n=1 Tax=Pseudomonas amygdali pv. lachrymans TaxID=53707 RepID=A0A0P9T6R5_PSEAV|nr:hypothetical protein ALO35_200190 [Pseudomonas amygdali pv. lachrymans]
MFSTVVPGTTYWMVGLVTIVWMAALETISISLAKDQVRTLFTMPMKLEQARLTRSNWSASMQEI